MQYVPVVSSVIAGLSLCLNAYLAYLLRNQPTNVSRREHVRTALFNLKNKLDETSLIGTAPHYEMWTYGFKSLEELREVAVVSLNALETAPFGRFPPELTKSVKAITDQIKELYRFRDSYTRFSNGREIVSQSKISEWADFEGAKHSLAALQNTCRLHLPLIDTELTKMY